MNLNLCQLARMLLLWTPLYLVLMALPVYLVVNATVLMPLSFLGPERYLSLFLFWSGVIGAFTVLALGVLFVINKWSRFEKILRMTQILEKPIRDWIENWDTARIQKLREREEAGRISMWVIFWRYLRDIHEEICSLIQIKG